MSKSDNPHAPILVMRHRNVTRDYARGVTIGAFVLTFFGAFWASEALTNWPQTPPWAYGVLGVPAVALTLFAILRFLNVAKLPEAVDGEQAARRGKRTGIAFGVVVAAEFILIAAASVAGRARRADHRASHSRQRDQDRYAGCRMSLVSSPSDRP